MVVQVKQEFQNSIESIWKAITEIAQMKVWFFDNLPDFKAEEGFDTAFNVKAPSRDFMHQWEVTKVIPNKLLIVNWTYRDISGASQVHFILSEINNSTLLTVECHGLESFPNNIPEFHPDSCKAGWEYFITDRLKNYMNNK